MGHLTPGGNNPLENKPQSKTSFELLENIIGITLNQLPNGFVIGQFQFKKEGYRDASINEGIIMKLNEFLQNNESKSIDEKIENISIVAKTIRKIINGEKATSESNTAIEKAVNEILSPNTNQQIHGGQSLNRLDFQNILNLLLINENNYSVIKEGELVNPSLQGSLSELIRKISLLDRYGYDSADDVKNDNGDIKSKIKDIKFTALGNIKEAIRVSEKIALAKKRKEEHKK